MSSVKKGKGRRSDDAMDDDSDEKDTKRKSRNLSEKKRRDQFNLLVNELSAMVSSGGRKMDKSTVLKSTISFLKNHNEIAVRSRVHEIQEDWKPSFLTNEEFTHLILDAVDGFIIVFSTSGQIYYASDNITSLLGHLPNDVLNTTIYDLASEKEQNNLYNILFTTEEKEGQVSFSCYLKRGDSSLMQRTYYELVHFVGYFRSDTDKDQNESRYNGYSGEADTRLLFIEIFLNDLSKNEFTSRHSLEWKFLFLDHRAPPIIGYLPFELLGTSGYDYYHVDDLDNVVNCHEALMVKGEGTSCYYRFLTKGEQWIWLQTRFYITYHQWNSKPEFIVCTHRVVSYMDMTQEPKDENETENFEVPTSSFSNGGSSWRSRPSKTKFDQDINSDCTSISADSPGSVRYQASESNRQQQYLEPPHYVAVIPMQPVMASISQPLPAVEMTRQQTLLHADLQRKHAELRASIGQQQAELMALSEQLFMTQFGLLPPPAQHPQVSSSYSYNNSGTMNSTNAVISDSSMPATENVPMVVQSEILNPTVSVSSTLTQNELYSSPESNSSLNLVELK
ncbi:hypothetical protein RN001_010155 [Aquatica leii]|uniref:Circadian locomoter output cycles protein kaput n=1 Tax=Aquatica leii TaxID=1421715 RepID=A0AAN7SFY0_9COLE|nr:hypothetical protein RN001_010155 [Aquatica leii]